MGSHRGVVIETEGGGYVRLDMVQPLIELAQSIHLDRTEGERRSGRLLDFRTDALLALRATAGWRAHPLATGAAEELG